MVSVDANVVLRIIIGDDGKQLAVALDLLQRERIHVGLTALIEVEWVLRSRYRYSRLETGAALTAFAKIDGVILQQPAGVAWAITRHALGADFADMIHIVADGDARAFVSFDKSIAKHAGKQPPLPIETLT